MAKILTYQHYIENLKKKEMNNLVSRHDNKIVDVVGALFG
jgi:hypothetical protein